MIHSKLKFGVKLKALAKYKYNTCKISKLTKKNSISNFIPATILFTPGQAAPTVTQGSTENS